MSPSPTRFRRRLAALLAALLLGALSTTAVGCASSDDLPADETDAGVVGGDTDLPDAASPDAASPDAELPEAECDVFAADCPEGDKCVPLPGNGVPICVAEGTQNPIGSGCEAYDECEAGSACASFEGVVACLAMCDPQAEVDTCAGDTYCGKTLGSNPHIGLCVAPPTPCDIYTQDCEAPQSCILTTGGDGELGAFCGQAGDLAQGEACSGGLGRCAEGLICVSIGGSAAPPGQPVCRSAADGGPACPAEMACDGFTSSSNISFCL